MAKKRVDRVVLPNSGKSAPRRAKLLASKVSPAERVEVTVRLRRKAGAKTPLAGTTPLSREEFRDAYGADPAAVEKIEEFANAHGLDVVQTSVSQRAVRLSGTAEAMQKAFGVRFKSYQLTKDKARFRGRTGTISVPKDIADVIEGVFGLDDRPQARPHFRVRPALKGVRPRSDAAKPMTPLQVANLYNFPAGGMGCRQCIAILSLAVVPPADLTAYFKNLGIKKLVVSSVRGWGRQVRTVQRRMPTAR
jgi:kumamolisin